MKIFQVDAFAEQPFRGNPAAVCLLTEKKEDGWLQKVAQEMNLSETAFLLPEEDGYRLRWFTPRVEVDLCGHATLASAHVLWDNGYLQPDETAKFFTRSGLLTAKLKEGWIEMDFPIKEEQGASPPDCLLKGLGCRISYIGKNDFDYLVEVESEEIVKNLKPNLTLLAEIPVRGIIVTSKGEKYDFVSRFFAPAVGIDEDPVTGSAHSCLVPYWSKKLEKLDFMAYQMSARGGEIKARLAGERVYLSGKAVTVLRGELI